jgi:hypothetical protein
MGKDYSGVGYLTGRLRFNSALPSNAVRVTTIQNSVIQIRTVNAA